MLSDILRKKINLGSNSEVQTNLRKTSQTEQLSPKPAKTNAGNQLVQQLHMIYTKQL